MGDMYLIEKRGFYYRPNAAGYTGLKRDAGRYTFEEAVERVGPNAPDGSQDGMVMWVEVDAPEFSTACPQDVRVREIHSRIAELEAQIKATFDRREAKLAKAVEALQSIASNTCCDQCREAALVARATLAELKGETDG